MTALERVRVGDVLQLQRREMIIDVAADYEEIGVRSFGKGIFHKELVDGASLGAKRVFRIEPGDLVISNVFAWEGAIAVASQAERGKIGSHRFMTFVARDGRIDTSWAAWFFLSEPGLELIRKASPGSAGRNKTLAVKRFEDLVIPMPPIDEQVRVATYLNDLRGRTRAVEPHRHRVKSVIGSTIDSASGLLLHEGRRAGWDLVPIGEIAIVNPARTRLAETERVAFVPMAAVDAVTGTIQTPEIREAGTVAGGYRQFKCGDVLFARITPCMQNGKSAVFEGPTAYGYGSTEFHVLRARDEAYTPWLHRFVRTHELRELAARSMTGTAGQQRVSAAFLDTASIPLPPRADLQEHVAALDRLSAFRQRLERLERRGDEIMEAFGPALLNQEFACLR